MKRVRATSPSAFAGTIGAAFAGAAHDAVARARMLGVKVAEETAPRAKAKKPRKAAKRVAKAPKRAKPMRSAAARGKVGRRKKAAARKRA